MRFYIAAAAVISGFAAAPAAAADRSFTVTGFDRIRVDGPFSVKLVTNVAPFARASGAAAALDAVSVDVQGRTLVIRRSPSAVGSNQGRPLGPVTLAVGTHELSAAWVNGSGSLAIDKVRGLDFELAVQGAGGASIENVAVDRLTVAIGGSGSVRLAGRADKVNAVLRGTSTLEATDLAAKEATLGSEGASVVNVSVRDTAKVDARGPTVVALAGRPACTVRAEGSAEVTGCR